jgi:hypothetical protein
MVYEPTEWEDNVTSVNSENLNKIEQGIATLSTDLATITNQGQISGFKIITQIEYDALGDEKNTNNILYLIRE